MVGFGWHLGQSERTKDEQTGMIQMKEDAVQVASVAERHHYE
jgi:hypothetical protein